MAEPVDLWGELSTAPAEEPAKREVCQRCRRPATVCICNCFPPEPVPIKTSVIILQHPNEESRCLATVPLLQQCLPKDRLHVIRGKRFASSSNRLLQNAVKAPDSVLLFPGRTAVDVKSRPPTPVGHDNPAALIVLDGTWSQASGMYAHNVQLQQMVQVQLSSETASEYVIRTQPKQFGLSTLECVAHALAWFEHNPTIVEVLVRPLRALCQYQLDHGAAVHVSKEHPDYIPRWKFKADQLEEAKKKSKETKETESPIT